MLTLSRCPFHPRVTAVARKKTRSFCQKCRWQVTPKHACPPKSVWADYAVVQTQCGNRSGKKSSHATRQGNIRPQSSQIAEPLWTYPGPKSGISVRELISTLQQQQQQQKSAGGDRMVQPSPQSWHARKKPPPELV